MTILFPCPECRADFADAVGEHPPQCASRREFVLWMCQQHNLVNAKLGVSCHWCVCGRCCCVGRPSAVGVAVCTDVSCL